MFAPENANLVYQPMFGPWHSDDKIKSAEESESPASEDAKETSTNTSKPFSFPPIDFGRLLESSKSQVRASKTQRPSSFVKRDRHVPLYWPEPYQIGDAVPEDPNLRAEFVENVICELFSLIVGLN